MVHDVHEHKVFSNFFGGFFSPKSLGFKMFQFFGGGS